MKYQTFTAQDQERYPIAFLVPKLERDGMAREYLDPGSLAPEEVIAYALHLEGKKTKVDVQREFLTELLPLLDELGTDYLLVSDGEYFKTLTGVAKTDAYLGYVLPNAYPESLKGRFQVLFVPNHRQVFYNPAPTRAKIKQALDALFAHRHDQYREPGCEIIKFAAYPESVTDIALWLGKLIEMDRELTCDIETFSLKHHSAGLGTITFTWNQQEGIAFPVDLGPNPPEVRKLLTQFFRACKRKITWHNASFDIGVIIYQLFMKDLLDTEGLLDGLAVMTRDFDDTKLIAYLAINSCAGNQLGLKVLAQEFSGNYAQDEIKDITKIPLPELLQYNLVDGLSTWFVKTRYEPIMDADEQREIYETLFKPALIDIIQMQLTGMPLDMEKVLEAKEAFGLDRAKAIRDMQSHKLIREFVYLLEERHVEKRNAELKKKQIKMGDEPQEFNPNSNPQKQALLYEFLGLPVIARTDAKEPAADADTLEKLKAHTESQEVKDLINALLAYAKVEKLYSTFIPAMEGAVLAPDGCHYLFGNFNLGGTVSGRLSSSNPNLQNLPAKGKYAKLIKNCFRAPKGWLMIGLDFASLEDRISALTTKDRNKLKVYTDGYDGHCLRAYSYFSEQMPDIDPTSVDSINSIADLYKDLRQDSKTPTFLLTYGGTWIGMIAKCGFPETVAKQIEARYHELYKESDDWVAARIQEATRTGYVTCAFGLRVRTPLLHQVVRGTRATPYEAEAEARTAGNALGQSWCLLNSRASVEFMAKVRASKFRNLIRPIAHIHDAQYYLIPDDIEVLLFVNEHLVKAVQWQDHPAIAHDAVKLGGELSIFWPSWAKEIDLPNEASETVILDRVAKALAA